MKHIITASIWVLLLFITLVFQASAKYQMSIDEKVRAIHIYYKIETYIQNSQNPEQTQEKIESLLDKKISSLQDTENYPYEAITYIKGLFEWWIGGPYYSGFDDIHIKENDFARVLVFESDIHKTDVSDNRIGEWDIQHMEFFEISSTTETASFIKNNLINEDGKDNCAVKTGSKNENMFPQDFYENIVYHIYDTRSNETNFRSLDYNCWEYSRPFSINFFIRISETTLAYVSLWQEPAPFDTSSIEFKK